MNFDSGWEWSYWLSSVVTARASWDPLLSPIMSRSHTDPDDTIYEAYREHDDQWSAFASSLQPITRIFGPYYGPRLNQILVELTKDQADLLVFGKSLQQ
jgi:hypothetical protein